jgi:hypothetical protein
MYTLRDTIHSGYQRHTVAYWRDIFEKIERDLEESCRQAIESLDESINQAEKIEAAITTEIREMKDKDQAEQLCRKFPNARSRVRKLLWAYFGGTESVDTPSAAVDDVSGPDASDSQPDMVSAPETSVFGPDADAHTATANVPGADPDIPRRDTNVPAPAADAPTSGCGNSSADVEAEQVKPGDTVNYQITRSTSVDPFVSVGPAALERTVVEPDTYKISTCLLTFRCSSPLPACPIPRCNAANTYCRLISTSHCDERCPYVERSRGH